MLRQLFSASIREKNNENNRKLQNHLLELLKAYRWYIDIDKLEMYTITSPEKNTRVLTLKEPREDFVQRVQPDDFKEFMQKLENCKNGKSDMFRQMYRLKPTKDGEYDWWLAIGITSNRYEITGESFRVLHGIGINLNILNKFIKDMHKSK